MKLNGCFIAAAIFLFAAVSCKKSNSGPDQIRTADVYVAGFTTASNNISVATYWKNTTATTLGSGKANSSLNAIVVQDGDVYVAGYNTSTSGKKTAAYWKNNNLVSLSDGTADCTANSITLSGSDVYVAGSSDGNAAYWKNGALTVLTDYGNGSVANGIAIQGSKLFVVGNIINPFGLFYAAFWYNGELGLFHPTNVQSSSVNAIILDSTGGMNVPGGSYGPFVEGANVNNVFKATYWSDGNVTQLAGDTTTYSNATGIAINGADTYISGITTVATGSQIATYWKNGTKNTLTSGSAYGIAVLGTDVYVAGDYSGGHAVYWKNGVAVKLSNSVSSGRGIAVVKL